MYLWSLAVFFVVSVSFPLVVKAQRAKKKKGAKTVVYLAPKKARPKATKIAQLVQARLQGLKVNFKVVWIERLVEGLPRQLENAKALAKKQGVLIVVWMDVTNARQVHFYYSQKGSSRILVRTVEKAGSEEGLYEVVGAIIQAGVEAMLSGAFVGWRIDNGEIPSDREDNKPIPSAPPKKRSWSTLVSMGYAVSGLSSQKPVAHAGIVDLGFSFKRYYSVFVGYAVAPFIEVEDLDTKLLLHRHTVRLGGGAHFSKWGFLVGGRLLGFMDLGRREIEVGINRERVSSATGTDTSFGMVAMLDGGYHVTNWMTLKMSIGARFLMTKTDYTMDGDSSTLLRPWVVQPVGSLGIVLRFF